eukprot:symbB.v1.2.017388.t1/scaffold1357.1/size159079/6
MAEAMNQLALVADERHVEALEKQLSLQQQLATAEHRCEAFLEVWESVVQMAAPGDKGESSPQEGKSVFIFQPKLGFQLSSQPAMADLTMDDAADSNAADAAHALPESRPAFESTESTAVMGDWDDAYGDEIQVSQQESQDVEAACELSPDTSTESESESSGISPKLVLWWTRVLRDALNDLGYSWTAPDPKHPLALVSACTGCSAEAAVLKASFLRFQVSSLQVFQSSTFQCTLCLGVDK